MKLPVGQPKHPMNERVEVSPAAQAMQLFVINPVTLEKYPAMQLSQAVELLLANEVPGGQPMMEQDDAPAVDTFP